jgi:hypothetical protein
LEDHVNNRRSWFGLITFCATLALAVALGSAVLFTTATVSFAAANSGRPAKGATQEADNPREKVFAGLVTDDHCGARHAMDSGKGPTECAKTCVRNGSKYELVEGDRKYALTGNESELEGLAGQRVKVVGIFDGKTIKVSSASGQ